jgi:hypothetical protein
MIRLTLANAFATAIAAAVPFCAAAVSLSGIHPHLAMFNDEGECGTGAVVPWADRLWVVTYGPHLPKGSHSYDGAHGWNTEWPRIREIGEKDFLMTMHGTFWSFPAGFGVEGVSGIRPRSN